MAPQLFSRGYEKSVSARADFPRTLLCNFATSCVSSSPSVSALRSLRSVSTKVWGLVNCSSSDQYDFRGFFCFFSVPVPNQQSYKDATSRCLLCLGDREWKWTLHAHGQDRSKEVCCTVFPNSVFVLLFFVHRPLQILLLYFLNFRK